MTDIYAASEQPIAGITAEVLAQRIGTVNGPDSVRHVPSIDAAVAWLCERAVAGDAVLTLGAGNVSQAGPLLLEALRRG